MRFAAPTPTPVSPSARTAEEQHHRQNFWRGSAVMIPLFAMQRGTPGKRAHPSLVRLPRLPI
jgi:hypothetical protein